MSLTIPLAEQSISIIVAEEILLGRLDKIRRAQASHGKTSLADAYRFLDQSLIAIKSTTLLPFTDAANALVAAWTAAKIRIGVRDMRIAAIAIVANCTLVTRNARDFQQLTGLKLDVWR